MRPKAEVLPGDLLEGVTLGASDGKGWRVTTEGATVTWSLEGFGDDTYPILGRIDDAAGRGWRLTGEAKAEGELTGAKLGVQLGDARGWLLTKSAAAHDGLEAYETWQPFSLEYYGLADTAGVLFNLRCEGKPEDATGVLRLRNLELTHVLQPTFPAVKMLTVSASKSASGDTLYLMVVNKSLHRSTKFNVDFKEAGRVHQVNAYTGRIGPWGGENEWLAAGQGMLLCLEK